MARILVVDDDEMDRLFERSVLEDVGHELYFARDGEVALQIYRDHAIDLVITDLHMPRLNGLRLIREIMELDGDATIIAVSGVSADQLDTAETLGAVHTLSKPLDPDALVRIIAEALEQRGRSEDVWGRA
jgi:two-component system chemotaxis response regulator CheY